MIWSQEIVKSSISMIWGILGKSPSHPIPAFPFHVMAFTINVMAFPNNVMAFAINGMAPGLAAAPDHGQVALGTKKMALALGAPGVRAPRHFIGLQRHLAMAWRRRQAWRHSINRERHNINWERHNMNWERHNINWKRRGPAHPRALA